MTKTIPRGRKQLLILLCALLLFGQVFSRPAYADGSKDVEISYTVTEDNPALLIAFSSKCVESAN